jgi:hypothetical protein
MLCMGYPQTCHDKNAMKFVASHASYKIPDTASIVCPKRAVSRVLLRRLIETYRSNE